MVLPGYRTRENHNWKNCNPHSSTVAQKPWKDSFSESLLFRTVVTVAFPGALSRFVITRFVTFLFHAFGDPLAV
jgi:hypothetical protein